MARRGVALLGADNEDAHPWLARVATMTLIGAVALRVLGLPPVDLHGPLHYVGVMDPLCGGSRGMVALTRGDLIGAWRYNPLAPAVAVGAVVALVRAVLGTATGRWINAHPLPRAPSSPWAS
jgi:hypothetical protein